MKLARDDGRRNAGHHLEDLRCARGCAHFALTNAHDELRSGEFRELDLFDLTEQRAVFGFDSNGEHHFVSDALAHSFDSFPSPETSKSKVPFWVSIFFGPV